MRRLALFLGTTLAVLVVLSLSLHLLGIEGLLQASGVDPDLKALLVFSVIIGFSAPVISLFPCKTVATASMASGAQKRGTSAPHKRSTIRR